MEFHDIDFWENLLSRQLDYNEKKIFHGVWNEKSLNIDIKTLQKNIIKHFCYIKSITNNVGNCLFESFGALGLGDNDLNIEPSKMIRKNLASLLLLVKTEIGFFPNLPNLTPEEIFTNYNDIEFIKDSKSGSIYIYDYDMMIYDLNSNYSWDRLPTEFLLMAISRIYQVEIIIYHNNTNYINKITVWNGIPDTNNLNIEKIRLGQINEEHYFPLEELEDEYKHDPYIIDEIINTSVKYDENIKKFQIWAKIMIDSINCVYPNNSTNPTNPTNPTNSDISISISNNPEVKIMKTNNKLTQERIEDYEQIENLEDFQFL